MINKCYASARALFFLCPSFTCLFLLNRSLQGHLGGTLSKFGKTLQRGVVSALTANNLAHLSQSFWCLIVAQHCLHLLNKVSVKLQDPFDYKYPRGYIMTQNQKVTDQLHCNIIILCENTFLCLKLSRCLGLQGETRSLLAPLHYQAVGVCQTFRAF